MRDHSQLHQEQPHRSKDKIHRHTRDADKAKLKKRNIFEVFKKPSNATETDKPIKQRNVIDKFELECLEILKVSRKEFKPLSRGVPNGTAQLYEHNFYIDKIHLNMFLEFKNSGQCKKGTHLSDSNALTSNQEEISEQQYHGVE